MDPTMPAFDGVKARGEIRSLPEFSNVLIVAVTAHGQTLRDAALGAGCTDVVDKPFVMEHIKEVIDKYFPEN
jgi:CheY-like chemotaxis protein